LQRAPDPSRKSNPTILNPTVSNKIHPAIKRQDNDLIVIESAEAAAAFKRAFDA
jgi:hypothetical protein